MIDEAYRQFGEWLQKQPFWIQDATWRLYNNQRIDEKTIDEYILMCIQQAKNKPCEYKRLEDSSIIPVLSKTKMAIHSITNVENVNALAENTSLEFSPEGVSVVYGLNGAGKSGFMRIFKHISGHRYAEPIQHNVYKKTATGQAKCNVTVCTDGIEEVISCDLGIDSSDNRLRQCDVFDTRISGAYITNSNSVSYEPFVFCVLRELAETAGRIEYAVKAKIESISDVQLTVPCTFSEQEDASWLTAINENTIIPEKCRIWTSADLERVDELKKLLDTKQVERELQNCRNKKRQLENVFSDMQKLKQAFKGEKRHDLIRAHEELNAAKKQYELAKSLFTENASEYDKVSVSLKAWRNLWKIGKEYYDECIHKQNVNLFGHAGSVCPLCLRELDDESIKRFTSVDEYVNGTCSETYTKAQSKFKEKIDTILYSAYSASMISNMLYALVDEELLEEVYKLYSTVELWQKSDDQEFIYDAILKINDVPAVDKMEELLKRLDEQISKLSNSLDIDNKEKMNAELIELQYRFWVYNQISVIETIISNAKKKSELNSVKAMVKTNKITTETNVLSEALITDEYIARFSKELKRLAPLLKVKLEKVQSTKGKSPYKVVLDTPDKARKTPQDVLSEGEQRIVALAAFFADATGRNEATPIVIDDPISSLDYNYEEAATARIIELAKERQVIVFTHRISLLVGLSERSEEAGVPFVERHIRGTLNGKGVSDFEETYHGKITTQLNGLKERIKETKKMDIYSHEYADSCSRISQQLRICVERSVEDILFQQMVKRFSRRIMTGKLLRMDRITKDDCAIIDSMMTKYSFGEHSQPEDSGLITMNLDDVIQDIDKFLRWIKEYNKKMN